MTPLATGRAARSCPVDYDVPRVSGDTAAALRIAAANRELADAVTAAQRQVAAIATHLAATWRGPAQNAAGAPVSAFLSDAGALARALDQAAGAYETYGRELARAHEQHHLSMTRLLKVGAIAAVSASAIVVTVGVAGAVEAAGAAAAVSGASEAAGSALLADAVVASSLEAALEELPLLRPLLAFVVPHLVQVEWAVGASAAYDEATQGRLRWRALADTGGIAFVASGAAAAGSGLVTGSRWLPRLVDSGVWAGAAAADDELVAHRFDVADVAEAFVLTGAGTAGRDALRDKGWWPQPPDYHRDALVALLHREGRILDPAVAHEMAELRQPVHELAGGRVDLLLHEGPGHTISRHVGRPTAELFHRARTSRIPRASTYWDAAGARDAIQQTLTAHHAEVKGWLAAGPPGTLRLRLTAPYDLGFAIDRRGTVTFLRHAMVVLRHDHAGVVLVTSYPVK